MKQRGYYDVKGLIPKLTELVKRDEALMGSVVQRSVIYEDHQKVLQHCITRIDVLPKQEQAPKPELVAYSALPLRTEVLTMDELLTRAAMLTESRFLVGQQTFNSPRNVNVGEFALTSNNPYGQWPGCLFDVDFNNVQLPMNELLDPKLPSYPNPIPAIKKFLDLPKFFNGDGQFGHILLYVPNPKARLSLLLEKQLLTIQVSSVLPFESLVIKISYFNDTDQQAVTLDASSKTKIELKFSPNALNIWLLTKDGEQIDYHEESLVHCFGANSILPKLARTAPPQVAIAETELDDSGDIAPGIFGRLDPNGVGRQSRGAIPERPKMIQRKTPRPSKRIFIIHGHSNGPKEAVARLLEGLGLTPVILHEQPNKSKTIIEKFEHHAERVGFAIALLTGDDRGAAKSKRIHKLRPRQNVIFEFGFFIGKLGRKKVCGLKQQGVEVPSDYDGVLYVNLDEEDHWKLKLAKELKSAGYDIRLDKVL